MSCVPDMPSEAAISPHVRPRARRVLFATPRRGQNAPRRPARVRGLGPVLRAAPPVAGRAAPLAMPTTSPAVVPPEDRTDPDGEKRLVDAALAGDEAALHRLATLLAPVIQQRVAYALLRRRTLYRGDARARLEDLVQDTFVELFREGGRVLRLWDRARGRSLTSFVGLVAEQQVYAFLRNRKASAKLEDLEAGDDDDVGARVDGYAWSPESQAATREQLRVLFDHLRAELSPVGRVLFERLLVNEEVIASVAADMNMSISAVQAWSSRLRRRAAALAEEILGDGPPAGAKAASR